MSSWLGSHGRPPIAYQQASTENPTSVARTGAAGRRNDVNHEIGGMRDSERDRGPCVRNRAGL
jgi:hypothetical protein